MIYLDYAATTPVDPEVFEAMKPFFAERFGNPSSLHNFGRGALCAVDRARSSVAAYVRCDERRIIFTSSATESNNLALRGLAAGLGVSSGGHIVSTAIEHESVLEPLNDLEQQGFEVTRIAPGKDGIIRVDDMEQALKPHTFLVSCMWVNNEIGTVQPVKKLGERLVALNNERVRRGERRIFFHCDAVQAPPYMPVVVGEMNVDFLTLSAHKIFGPKGVAVLYAKERKFLKPLLWGGGQEQGLRSSTLNVPGIVGMGAAVELLQKEAYQKNIEKMRRLRDELWGYLQQNLSGVSLNGSGQKRVPGNLNIHIEGVEAQRLLTILDQAGIALSGGSACSAGSLEPSHVLLAMGLSKEQALSSVRISLGAQTREKDVKKTARLLVQTVDKLRKRSGRRK